jgi:hypothetical protein
MASNFNFCLPPSSCVAQACSASQIKVGDFARQRRQQCRASCQ